MEREEAPRRRSFTPEFKAEIVELCQRGDSREDSRECQRFAGNVAFKATLVLVVRDLSGAGHISLSI